MKIFIIAVGKSHDANIKLAIDDYQKRLSHHVAVEWKFIPTSDLTIESTAISKLLGNGYSILLDESGNMQSTTKFADKIESLQNNSIKQVNFIIGGAYGVTDELKKSVNYVWSLSELVFPHQLVRLLLVEQLYRAYDILSGGKYHHK